MVEREATVTGDVVCPVLQDTPETWAAGAGLPDPARAGRSCDDPYGGHVQVGADSANLDHDVNRFRRVGRVCAWAEDLMYRLAEMEASS